MAMTARPDSSFLSTLPGRYYYDPAIYELEQERIFSQMWICAGRADTIAEPGAYQVVTIGRESVIIVRGRDGELRAFFNVCRHRGARLCTEATGHLKGSIQCRYHAWTYGLDGRLIGATNVLAHEEFDRTAYGLLPVALEIWEGFIWLNLTDNPPPIADQLHPVIIERFGSYTPFARYGVGNLKRGKTITYQLRANWKLVLENFMECYHCAPMHPELCDLLPGFRSGKSYANGDAARLADGAEAFTVTGKASRPPLPGLLAEDLRRYYGEVLLPNMLLNLFDDHVVVHTVWPEGPESSRVTCDWLFDPEVMSRPDFDPLDAVEIFDLVNRQDWEVCELTQLSMASKAYRSGGVYVPAERHIRAFADFICERLA
ncbi:MAG: aromatic ring-hydroxylating dioxygenase subunit alpha [Ktedonobacteraceae bacterium]|nr:aromatic ring-hydroxylating dioxygenase subunit alpha [Ktedonobacteraceae bacterium]MBO0790794.1 aromatic ring-hydroxylating dioxygenase subunit alpha [Ktedonobacteraceae bacterium]